MPHRALIGVGSNLGDRKANIAEALDRAGKSVSDVLVYTAPVGSMDYVALGHWLTILVLGCILLAEGWQVALLDIDIAAAMKQAKAIGGAALAVAAVGAYGYAVSVSAGLGFWLSAIVAIGASRRRRTQ